MTQVFRVLAVMILLAFYGCYYAKLLCQRKQGIKTDRLGKGKVGFVRAVERGVKLSTILVVVVEVASILLDTTRLPPWARYAGAGLGISGVFVFISAVLTMGDSWRAGVPETGETRLVTRGIFSVSRNPAFLGFDLVYLGILLMFFNWILFAASVFAVFMLHLQIVNVEEDFLLATFGDEYAAYKKTVNRYLGRRGG